MAVRRCGGGGPAAVERLAGRLLRSPGLARALVTTPSLLLGWVHRERRWCWPPGQLATRAAARPSWRCCAAGLAAAGIAYAYGPGIDPAWELCLQHGGQRPDGAAGPRARGLRAQRAARGGCLGRVRGRGGAHLRLADPDDRGVRGWPWPSRPWPGSANAGAAAGLAGWVDHGARPGRPSTGGSPPRSPTPTLVLPYLAVAACGAASSIYVDPDPERSVMNIESSELTRRFGRTEAVDGVT